MLKRAIFGAAVAATIAWGGGAARADLVIDDFTIPNPTPGFVLVPTLGVSTASAALPGGVTRTLTVTETANLGGGETRYRVGTVPGVGGRLTLTTGDTTANIRAAYTYSTAQNLSALGTSLQFTFATADFGVPYSVQVSDGTNTATQSGTTFSGPGAYSFSIGSFGGGVNLSAITSIVLSLNRNLSTGTGDVTSADFSLSAVEVLGPTGPPPVVPAPPAAVLALAALPLLGLARVRRSLVA